MIQEGEEDKVHRTTDSLTIKHTAEALTLTTEHLTPLLAAESMTTANVQRALANAAKSSTQPDKKSTTEKQSTK
jgi:hypothetical protein